MTTSQPKRALSPLALVLILSGIFFAIFLAISGIVFMSKSSGVKSAQSIFGGGSVAVVEVNGVIMNSKKTLKRLERIDENADIKAVVLRLNSPGGSVAPSQEIYEAVRKLKKPVVASMSSVAASGAFYIAMGAKKIYANPGTITGSIGVIMEFANLEKLYDWAKIKRFAIKTGKFKDAGAEYREMTSEERALLQGMVDDVLVQFKQAVVAGRKLPMAEVSAIADGRILSGNQAKAAKLVDELGTFQDAVAEAARLGGIKGKPHLIYAEPQRHKLLDLIFQDDPREEGESESIARPAFSGILGRLAQLVLGENLPLRSAAEDLTGRAPGIYWLWTGAR